MSYNFVIWKTLQPNTIASAAACSSGYCVWSTWSEYSVPGGDAGDEKRCQQAVGESCHAPNRLPQSTFFSHGFSSPILPAAPVQSFKPGCVSHFKNWGC